MRVRNLLKYLILFWLVILLADQTQFFMATNYFKIVSIESDGDYSLTKRDIIDKIIALKGANIWYLDNETIEQEIKKDVRVKSVKLIKAFPDTIKIAVEERVPFVYVRIGHEVYIADESGKIFAYREEMDPGRLIMVDSSCQAELEYILKVVRVLKGSFRDNISNVYKDSESVKLVMKDGFVIKTALDVDEKKYDVGYRLYLKIKEEWLKGRPRNEYMDLRFNDYIVK